MAAGNGSGSLTAAVGARGAPGGAVAPGSRQDVLAPPPPAPAPGAGQRSLVELREALKHQRDCTRKKFICKLLTKGKNVLACSQTVGGHC